jgi:hypothetical protein
MEPKPNTAGSTKNLPGHFHPQFLTRTCVT